jgi:hypothetical protein
MLSKSSILGLAAMPLLAFGCNKSGEAPNTHSAPAAAIPAKASLQDAKEVVTNFLGAFRKGDNEAATVLLTKLARQKVAEMGRNVAPPPNERVQIEVEDALFPKPDDHTIAHVPAKWIVPDELGKPRADSATWVCRLEEDGWRVAGFAAYVFENEEPLLLSFEEPEKMVEKEKWLTEELERRSKQNAAPPTSSDNSSQAAKPRDAFQR